MKTLDEIINRQDYVRVNEALVNRAQELAAKFADKFDELMGSWDSRKDEFPPETINVNGHSYCAKWNIRSNNFDRFTDGIRFVVVDLYGERVRSLNRMDYGVEASHKEYVDFLNDAKDILKQLAEVEDKLVAESEDALENAKNL